MGFDCGEWVVLSGWGVRASLAAEHGLQSTGSVGVAPGSAALRHVESSWIRDEIHISCIGRWILNHWTTREPPGFHSSCFGHVQIFCNPADCSLPGASVWGILQARILEWAAISSSRGSSRPRDWTCVSCIAGGFFTAKPPGKPPQIFLWILK